MWIKKIIKATFLSIYVHEVISIFELSTEIKSKYDLSSVETLKVAGTYILPVYKQGLAELMPNLRQINNVYYNKYI